MPKHPIFITHWLSTRYILATFIVNKPIDNQHVMKKLLYFEK